MKIIQLMPTISYGDAVSNDAIAIYNMLKKRGYKTIIYAENIDPRISGTMAKRYQFNRLKSRLKETDYIIYHGSTGTAINEDLSRLPGRKLLRYHNITPPCFFEKYSLRAQELSEKGCDQFGRLTGVFQRAIADSSFNRDDLLKMGYRCKIDVCPILIPFEDYKKKPDESIIKRYKDEKTNILFVGRIAPNKKQEDVIASFYAYQKLYNPDSRMIFVGSWNGMEPYYNRLVQYAEQLGISDKVIFTGHISFSQILAYYQIAHVFLCLSEHEGFCVPLVEAMCFRIPIIAYDKCAVGETLGSAGVLLESKDPEEAAAVIDYVLSHESLCETIRRNQTYRLMDFSHDKIERTLISIMKDSIQERN